MYNVLVCDDQCHVRELLSEAVASMRPQATVLTAVDGENALEVLRKETIHLLFLDVDMPRLDGFSTLEKIRDMPSGNQLQVVMVTGRDAEADFIQGWGLSADSYIAKPFNLDEIALALEDFENSGKLPIAS